jgi:hypothetical protein
MKSIYTFLLLCLCTPLLHAGSGRKNVIDPDDAYKNNCMRCHAAVRQYSPRQTATIVTHMRVRANLTEEEARAILEYLAGSAPGSGTETNRHNPAPSVAQSRE